MARVAEPPQHQGERGEPEIGLGLAAAGGEEEQVHEFALETRGIRNPREVQQQESQLKGAPTRRLCDPFPGQTARERRGHGPVRHAEGVERVPILCEHEDAVLHPVRGKPGVAEQLLGGIPALPGQVGQSAALLVDPGPVARHQGRQRLLGGGPVREVAERRHAELHARRLHGFRLLHFGRRSPAGSKPVAGAVLGQLPVGGNSVAGGVFGDTRILQIRDELIPIVAGHHTRVGTSDERHLTADLDLDLKGERLISTAVGPSRCVRSPGTGRRSGFPARSNRQSSPCRPVRATEWRASPPESGTECVLGSSVAGRTIRTVSSRGVRCHQLRTPPARVLAPAPST